MYTDKIKIITQLYNELKNECIRQKKKIIKDSVLCTLIKMTSNSAYRILKEVSVSSTVFPLKIVNELIQENLVRYTDESQRITLTGHGIWRVEEKLKKEPFIDLLNFIDEKYIKLFHEKESLEPREKITLLSLIAGRAFSKDSSMDLKKSIRIGNSWKEVIDLSYNFLSENKIVEKIKIEDIYGKGGNEPPVSYCMRRANGLPKKTDGIFIFEGNQVYYLDLYKDGGIKINKLVVLFKSIFGDKLDYKLIESIYNFCYKISKEKCLYLFSDIGKHVFATHDYDMLIKKSLQNVFLG